ncbi:MAG: hypothetical protein LBP86_03180 [Azoarcus sp.]|jgi:hypothetical protein|nr:hypothetical protein [Azoarcus sp.]
MMKHTTSHRVISSDGRTFEYIFGESFYETNYVKEALNKQSNGADLDETRGNKMPHR